MPRGQGRNGSNVEKVAGRRNCSFLRSSLGESNKFFPEERQISALVLGNTEQSRCIIFTLVAPELQAYCKLATLLQSLQGPDERNHFPSAALSESPPTIIFLVNLQKEHKTNLSENTCSPESSSACSSSGMNTMGQSRNRNKITKSLKDSSNTSAPRCLAGDTSSGSLCDSLSPLSSDDLVSDISKVEKPLKKSSKKRAKKRGKNYKRSTSKKDSTDLEGHFEGSTCSAPVVEASTVCPPACSAAQISENLSENAISPPSFLVENISMVKGNNETDNYADSSTTMMSCISYKDEMEKSEAVVSLSQGFSHEEYTNTSTGELITTSSTTHSPERVPSTVYVNIRSASPKRSSNPNDNSTSISMDLYDDETVVSSLPDHLKSDESENCSNDDETRLALKDKSGLDISREEDSDSRKHDPLCCRTTANSMVINGVPNDCATSECYWPEVLHADTNTERAECSSQACSSSDFHPVLSGKRGRTTRKLTAHTGKDNNNPVWQKVQKMDTRHCISKPKNLYAVSTKVDSYSKDSGARVKLNASPAFNQKVKTGKHLYSYEIVTETSKSNEINDRKKHSSVSKKLNHYSMKGSHNGNVNTPIPSKIHIQQKEGLKILPQVNHDEHSCSGLSSRCKTDFPIPMVKSTGKLDFCPSVQQQKREEHVDEAALSGNTCSTAGEMTSSAASNQIGLLPSTLDSSGQSHKIHIKEHADNNDFRGYENMHNNFDLMDSTDNQCKKLQAELSHAEYSEADDNFGPAVQKWVPVGRKDAAVSHTEHVENSIASESISNMVGSKNAEIEVSSDVQYSVPSTETKMQYSSRSGDDADCSSSEADILSDTLMTCSRTAEDFGVANKSNFQLTCEVEDQIFLKTDLDKILHAVNNACKLHTAAGIHLISRSPLAEFERFLRSASPVISQRHHNGNCLTCSGQQQTSDSLCLHQIHNLTLGSLWQWYEEPGCYGLEVKAEDSHKSKRLCDGFVEFRAYFVPYLSAVQLFGRSGSNCASSSEKMTVSCEVDKTPTSLSNLSSLPVFSVLLPQRHKKVDACFLESTSPATNEFCDQSVKETNPIDGKLIFEYFEHAQPPQRRSLFEKINELVSGDYSPNSYMYGDPLKLECLSLHDLHPASWYAVAWYPIYRIPEGNFRAAFLTYHSLGHFIHQSASSNMAGDFTRIISPVVGLQSYNAKKECWFRPRDMKPMEVQKEEDSPSKLLEERLKTLEQTAFVMATATVCKGNQRSVNNHPDYNHFSSRW